MTCIVVDSDFESKVNARLPADIRLGARLIDNGLHAGGRFVNTAIIASSPEWYALFRAFIVGGTAVNPDGSLDIQAGKTVIFDDPTGGEDQTFTILDLDPLVIFNQPPE